MTAGLKLFSSEASQPAVIEIIGRPGSGKSSLCKSLLESPGWQMEPGAGEPGRRWLAPLTLMLRPIVTILATAVASTRTPNDLRRYREVVRVVRKYDGMRRIRGRRLTVVDEGAAHQLLNVLFWSSSTPASRFFTRLLLRALARRPATFVYLDTPKDVALENTRRRNHPGSWFNNEMSEEVAARYIADTSYDEILETLKSVAPGKVRSFSNMAEALEFVDSLAKTGTATRKASMLG
jgi:hypothetical protein